MKRVSFALGCAVSIACARDGHSNAKALIDAGPTTRASGPLAQASSGSLSGSSSASSSGFSSPASVPASPSSSGAATSGSAGNAAAPFVLFAPLPSAYATAGATKAKAIGTTSVVLKVTLDGGFEAAFKPQSRKTLGLLRYKGEVAAYRLAQKLGLRNVPPAIPRNFDPKSLRNALAQTQNEAIFDREIVTDANGQVHGALIPWIPRREEFSLEREPWRPRWQVWLYGPLPADSGDRVLASQIATMIVFDVVTGNWDRWSGGNIAIDRPSSTLLFIDNDGAFYETVPREWFQSQLATIRKIRHFPKRFVDNLRAVDRASMKAAFGDDHPGEPLLSENVVSASNERRLAVLRIIDATIAKYGESDVLAFD